MIRSRCLPILLAGLLTPPGTYAQLRPHALFTDHAVLQRDVPVPVWGTARPGERIVVAGVGKPLSTQADRQGRWAVTLPAQPAGGPVSLSLTGSASGTLVLRDLVYGDVWLCSGQSNMQMRVRDADRFADERTQATDGLIRHVAVPTKTSLAPLDTLPPIGWVRAAPETVGDFTGVGYFFAKAIRDAQPNRSPRPGGVPIGLLNASWGGTRLECWSSLAAMGYRTLADAKAYHQTEEARRRAEVKKYNGDVPNTDLGLVGTKAVFAATDYDDAAWKTVKVPSWFWGDGKELFDGTFWLRKTIDVPTNLTTGAATLSLGHFSDALMVWVNGVPVDTAARVSADNRRYTLPTGLLHPGRNVIALRIQDEGGATGVWLDEGEQPDLRTDCTRLSLAGDWTYTLTAFQYKPAEQFDTAPTLIYNAMIAPLLRFPIKGVLWYQGEANTWPMPGIYDYRTQLVAMATDWRKAWGNVPFLIVQLPGFGAITTDANKASNWALLRESQAVAAQTLPNAALITTLDVGNPADVHPTNKQTVGERLALAARALAYGEPTTYLPPTPDTMTVDGREVRLQFRNTAGGLRAHDPYGYLKGFVVAGRDQKFHWAAARLDGDAVIVSSPDVPNPVAVRYAWASSPVDANLFGGTGLPVGTFRTDTWPIQF